jgi:hypothetical protein
VLLIIVLSSLVMTKMDGDPLPVGLLAAEHGSDKNTATPSKKSVERKFISVDPLAG